MINWRKPLIGLALNLKGEPVFKHLRFLKAIEYTEPKDLLLLQKEKLARLLRHAAKNVPYYQRILTDTGVVAGNTVNIDKFDRIPVLTKAMVGQLGKDLYSSDYHTRRYYHNSTGGSTGEPMAFIQDKNYEAWAFASRFLFDLWAGKDVGEREILLWGSQRDVLGQAEKLSTKMRRWGFNMLVLNSFMMSEQIMTDYIDRWNKFKPKQVWSYTNSIYEFAKFVKHVGVRIFSPTSIICAAETLRTETREYIEDVFNCPAINQYGSREAGAIACECLKKEGLHTFVLDHKVEILDGSKSCKPGQTGRVHITTLNNYSMPLIRYDMGDMAISAGDKRCSCGRGWPLLGKVVGRHIEVFRTKDGRTIPAEFFIHFIGVVYNKGYVKKFQVVQKDYDQVVVRMVVADNPNLANFKAEVTNSIRKVMGQDCVVQFEYVDDILPANSGKYLYTICEIPPR